MLDPKQIETWIADGLPCEHLSVEGDGHHFAAMIVSREFVGLNRVKRQQLVYGVLADVIRSGALHAVNIRALTAAESRATD